MFILDSSAIIDVVHGNERGTKILDIVGNEKFYITAFSVNEILFSEKSIEKMKEFIEKSYVFNFDKEAAKISVQIEKDLRKTGKMINKADIFIAAICMQTNSMLVACDKDFKKVTGLNCVVVD